MGKWVLITYLIYIVIYECLVLGGTAFIIVEYNRSGWWMLLGILMSTGAYKPSAWAEMYKKDIKKSQGDGG